MKTSLLKILFAVVTALMLTGVLYAAPVNVGVVETAAETTEATEYFTSLGAVADTVALTGDGTAENPYVISSPEEFNYVSSCVSANAVGYSESNYVLGGNIDFTGVAFEPIGTSTYPFKGTIDGNGYKLCGIEVSDKERFGVIGTFQSGCVKNLCVDYGEQSITTSSMAMFGGIAAYVYSSSSTASARIENCCVHGDLEFTSSRLLNAGGVAGKLYAKTSDISFENCASYCNISVDSSKDVYAGGFAAHCSTSSGKNYTFKNCIAYSNVCVDTTSAYGHAGVFSAYANKDESGWTDWYGVLEGETYSFENSVAVGNAVASSSTKSYAGGFVSRVNGSDVTFNGCIKSKDATVSATTVSDNAQECSAENISNGLFLSENHLFDFENMWYTSKDGIHFVRANVRQYGAPITKNTVSLRVDSFKGIRFSSTVNTFMRDYAAEYGFIIALADDLDTKELTFDYDGTFVYGAAFNPVQSLDKIFSYTEDELVFTAVLLGVPEEHYTTGITARPYLKYVFDGQEKIIYGSSVTTNMSEVAQSVKNSDIYENLSDEEKQTIEKIISA